MPLLQDTFKRLNFLWSFLQHSLEVCNFNSWQKFSILWSTKEWLSKWDSTFRLHWILIRRITPRLLAEYVLHEWGSLPCTLSVCNATLCKKLIHSLLNANGTEVLFSPLKSQKHLLNMQKSQYVCLQIVHPKLPLKFVLTYIILIIHMVFHAFFFEWIEVVMLQFSTDIGTSIGKTCKYLYTIQDPCFLQLTQPGSVTTIISRSSNKLNHTTMLFQTEYFTFKCMSFFPHWIQWPLFPLTPRVSIHYAISIKVLVHWKLLLPEEPMV